MRPSPRHPSAAGIEDSGRRRWRTPIRLAAVCLLVAAVALLLGFGLRRDPNVAVSQLQGRPAPAFELRTLDGERLVRLGDLRGQVVVINFWASWCTECRLEHPALASAWNRYRDQGVVVIGITVNDRLEDSRAFASELGGDWPLLSDPDSRTALAYGLTGVPETYFVDREGRIQDRVIGPVTYAELSSRIGRLVGDRS